MRFRRIATISAILSATLIAAARVEAAPAPPAINHARLAVIHGHHVTTVLHVDAPLFGSQGSHDPRFAGASSLQGPITDPGARFAARLQRAPAAGEQATTAVVPASTWCGTERTTDDTVHELTNLARYKVVYAYPSDQPDRLGTYKDLIQQAPTWVANKVADGDGALRAPRFDYGTDCGAQYVDIVSLQLPHSQAYYGGLSDIFDRATAVETDVANALPAMGLEDGPWNYLVFADGVSVGDPRSVGYLAADDTPGPENASNYGGYMALVLGSGGTYFVGPNNPLDYLAYSVTHEIGHTLGAVNNSAPHATGAFHCTDGIAIMCYDDGGPNGAAYSESRCTGGSLAGYTNVVFDCGNDDYLSSAPPPGSYLATHWNVFSSEFMCTVDLCLASQIRPHADLQADVTYVPAGTLVTLDASGSSAPNRVITHYRWDLDGDGTFETDGGKSSTIQLTRDHRDSVTPSVQVTDEDNLTDVATSFPITFEDRVPASTLSAPGSASSGQSVTLDASGSTDPDAGDQLTFAFDLDGNGTFERATGMNPTTTTALTGPGPWYVGVEVTDTWGQFSVARTTIGAPPATPSSPPVNTQQPPTSSQAPTFNQTASSAEGEVVLVSRRAVLRGRRLAVRVSCVGGPCDAVAIRAGGARRTVTFYEGQGRKVTLKLSVRQARHARRHPVRVIADGIAIGTVRVHAH